MCRGTFHDIQWRQCIQLARRKSHNSMCDFSNFKGRSRSLVSFLLVIFLFQVPSTACESTTTSESDDEPDGIHIASWNWDHVGVFITITGFIVFSGLAKVGERIFTFNSDYLVSPI
jgi:hypothetical protein